MILANCEGRAVLRTDDGFVDVATASAGAFGPDPMEILRRWVEFREWADTDPTGEPLMRPGALQAPVPSPAQIFGVGINYADHALEAGLDGAATPLVFTKLSTSIAGPEDVLAVPNRCETLDWEVELVVVIGAHASEVDATEAWDVVAGLTIGQDITHRELQFRKPNPPQFGLSKSLPGFAPIGPWLVTPDEMVDATDLEIRCSLNGEVVQAARTSRLVFGVAQLIEYLSGIVPLQPGDLIFTGTPQGAGAFRTPPRYLCAGDVLESTIEGIGSMVTRVGSPNDMNDSGSR